MKLYKKNTKISIEIQGDGQELFDYSLPQPHNYTRTNEQSYTIEYYLHGNFFCTNKSGAYLNDILARFTLSMNVRRADAILVKEYPPYKPLELYKNNQFNGLRSIEKFKYRETVNVEKDNVFWAIKLYTESLIKKSGEGSMIAYSLLKSFAFAHFVDRVKDRSTLKAKCRSIWEWYDERDWTIPKRSEKTMEETRMTRSEHMRRVTKERAEKNRAIVINCITGLMADEYKKKSGSWHYGKICEATKLSPNTVKKYIKEFENETATTK